MSLLFYNTCFYSIQIFAQAPTSDDEDSELDKPINLFTQDEKKKGGHKKSKVAEYLMDEDSVASPMKAATIPKLEIFPDPKRGPTDEHDPPASKKKKGFKEDIVAICNHRKYAGERTYDLLMEMKSGWRGWGTGAEIHNDVIVYEKIHLLEEYMEAHGLTKEDLGVEVIRPPKVVVESESDDDEDDEEEEEEILVCKFDHMNWLHYQPEGNPAYCGKNAMFGDVKCFRCNKKFVSDKKNFNDGKYNQFNIVCVYFKQ